MAGIEVQTGELIKDTVAHRIVSCSFCIGDIVRVKKETFHGKRKGRLAEVLGINDIGWPRIKYDEQNIETLPTEFLELVCFAKARSN